MMLAVGLASGCGAGASSARPAHTPRAVLGSRADVHTRAGDYAGYRVITGCERSSCLSVQGLGTQDYPGMEVKPGQTMEDSHQALARFKSELVKQLGDIPVHGSSFGGVCGAWETILEIHDWRQVDAAVARIGGFLANDLRQAVAICVSSEDHWIDL